MTSGGAGIIPLTRDEALEWCETHEVDSDEITKHFPELGKRSIVIS